MKKHFNTVMTLEMSLKAAVYRANDDSLMAQIAEKNCFNINTFRSSLNPTTTTHKANIYHLEAVLSETKDPRIMDSLCAIHGKAAWLELPEISLDLNHAEYISKIGELANEQGQLAQSVAQAIADGFITKNEHDQIQKEVLDLIRVASTILTMVQNQLERDNG